MTPIETVGGAGQTRRMVQPQIVGVEEWQQAREELLFTNSLRDLAVFGRQEDWEDSPEGWPQHPTYG